MVTALTVSVISNRSKVDGSHFFIVMSFCDANFFPGRATIRSCTPQRLELKKRYISSYRAKTEKWDFRKHGSFSSWQSFRSIHVSHALNPSQSAWESSVSLTEGSSRCTCSMARRNSRGCCGRDTQSIRSLDGKTCRSQRLMQISRTEHAVAPPKRTESDERAVMRFLEKDEIHCSLVTLCDLFGGVTACSVLEICIRRCERHVFPSSDLMLCVSLPHAQQPREFLLAILHVHREEPSVSDS